MLGHSGAALDVAGPVQEAADLLSAYRLPALPVLDGGRALGVVTAGGLVGARSLRDAARPVPSLAPELEIEAARAALDGHPAILVDASPPGALVAADLAPGQRLDLTGRVWAALKPEDAQLLRALAEHAGPDARLALVGGAVRDALLGLSPSDLDVTVVGGDVRALAQASGLPFSWHARYQNAALKLPDGRVLDLVSARAEAYPVPGGPPAPRPGTLAQDLARRDFGLNALALVVGEEGLQDPLGGLAELEAGTLRPLHAHSLRDDASRLVRAARLSARLGFTAHPQLLAQVPEALAVANQTPRLWQELRLALDEPRPGLVFARLDEWGAGELLPGVAARLRPLDVQRDAGAEVPDGLYAALLLKDQPELAERLGLGDAPLRLLDRARDGRVYGPDSLELRLRALLGLPPGPLLRGEDLIGLGVAPGPQVGRWLAEVERRTRSGELGSREAALDFVRARLRGEG